MDSGLIGTEGNKAIVDWLTANGIGDVPGDVLEIGSYTGATTRQLALWAKPLGKQVYTVDVWDLGYDWDRFVLYSERLGENPQRVLFDENISGLGNVTPCSGPSDQLLVGSGIIPFCCVFVDGDHRFDAVQGDLQRAWNALMPGGAIICHDYRHDIEDVTRAIDEFADSHRPELDGLHKLGFTLVAMRKDGICPTTS